MIETSTSIVALTGAIIKVQGEIEGVHKDGKNPHFKSKYATLENVIDTARPALQEARIAFVQAPGQVIDNSVEVTTMLIHESGEWMRSTLHVPLGKRDPQGVGSAITYGLRYSLMAMLGLPPTDDDGESAMDRGAPIKSHMKPNGVPEKGWRKDGTQTSYALKNSGIWDEFQRELAECSTIAALKKFAMEWSIKAEKDNWNQQFHDTAKEAIEAHKRFLINGAPDDDVFPGDRVSARDEIRNHPLNGG